MYTDGAPDGRDAVGWTRRRDDVRLTDSGARITRKPKGGCGIGGRTIMSPRAFSLMSRAGGTAVTIVTCGGTKAGGSQARIDGRRSTGSRATSAWRMAPTRAPEASRSPHSSIVQLFPAMLMTT